MSENHRLPVRREMCFFLASRFIEPAQYFAKGLAQPPRDFRQPDEE